MTRLESRLFAQSFVVGIICTLIVVTAEAVGLLTPLDEWLYDKRATYSQFASSAPSSRIAHLDIDESALDAVGRWPWPRSTLARILNELHSAAPSAIGLDILFPEPQAPRVILDRDGTAHTIDDDAELAEALRRTGVSVLAASFNLEAADTTTSQLQQATDWFKSDLEMTRPQLLQKLGPVTAAQDSVAIDALFVHARGLAMQQRIEALIGTTHGDFTALEKLLLPRTDLDVNWPQTRQLKKEFLLTTASHAVSRFGAPSIALELQPLKGTLSAVPLAAFSDAVAGCGFANYDIFDNATVRSIPLFVQYKNQLYPQFGLAVACVSLGANPKDVRVESNRVIIPSAKGTIEIPTYTYHSKSLGVDVPLIAAVPWFGGRDWQTMYDWPRHRDSVGHISITKVWDICLTEDVIARNSERIDKALSDLLDNDQPQKLEVNPERAKHYASKLPDPLDTETREAAVQAAFKDLKDLGWMELYDAIPEKEMKPEDHFLRDNLHAAVNALNAGIAQNRDARQQLDAQRHQLAALLGGKAVFIGLSDVSLEDKVSTSLHQHCPGVVVHGVVASAVMTGAWLHMAPTWIVLSLTLLLGFVNAAAQGRLPPLRAGLFALGLAIVYWIFNWGILFAMERAIVGMAGPLVVIAVVWAVCTLQRVLLEGVERIRIDTENAVFQKEMSLARKVQFALVPDKAPEMPGLNADGWTLPADMTGGDLFDLWKLPDGRLGILVADASGHGLAPAMIVSQVRTLVHMLSEYEPNPHDLLRRVNTRLSRDLETGRFVTAFLAFISADGEFEWASAGHGPMYWCPTGEGELLELDSSGLPLGIQEDWLADDPSPPLKMELTGRLIVFSDGIFEAHAPDPKAGLFGTDAIKEILHNACHASSSEIIHSIREAVQKFQGKKEPVDDQTIVVVRRIQHIGPQAVQDSPPNAPSDALATVHVPVSPDFDVAIDNPLLEHPPG